MTWLWALAVIAACGGGGGGGGGGATDGSSSGGTSSGGTSSGGTSGGTSGGGSSGSGPTTYAVGGTLSGLAGPGLVLQNGGGDDLSPTANGPFKFATQLAAGAAYSVTVKAAPPAQVCSVNRGSGTVGTADVTTVAVVCAGKTFKIGGKVTGLAGTLVLQDNGGDDLTLTADGAFTFPAGVAQDAGYAVTVKTQPAGQTCTIAAATGVANRDIGTVAVTCAASAYPVGATVVGLTGTLVLQDNGGDDLTVTADGKVTFPTALADGSNYAVTVKTQPTGQTCAVAIGTGKVNGAAVNVAIACAASHTLYVTATGVSGTVNILNNGTVIFATTGNINNYAILSSLIDGTPYDISAAPPKNYHCSVQNGSGTVSGADVHVTIACAPDTYSVGGTVVGLAAGETVVLQNNGNEIPITGATFAFPPIAVGATFDVTIKTQPSTQTCTVSKGSGVMGTAAYTDAVVTCSAVTYAVSGVAQGLTAPVVLQINGAGDTTVAKDGGFTLAQRLPDAASYLVTVKSSGPGQSCTVSKGSGTIAAADVGTVNILCSAVTPRRAYVARPGSLKTYPLDGTTGAFGLPTSTVASGTGPTDVVVAPDGKHLFVTDAGSSWVSSYAIDAAGDPSFVASFATGKRPRAAAVDPSSRFVYTANNVANSVSAFAIDAATGKLTEVPGSPFNAGTAPESLTIDPTGARLFEAGQTADGVYGFTIGTDGALTSLAGTPFKLNVSGFAVSPDGKWGFGTDPYVYYAKTYTLDSSGAPAPAFGIVAPKVQGAVWGPPVLDPTGKHLYQPTRGTQSSPGAVYAFTVGAKYGELTPVAGSPFTAGNWAQKTVVEPSGRFVYVANAAEFDISAFARDAATGTLTPVAGGPMAKDVNPMPWEIGAMSFGLSP